ncbi:hypothetical protein CBS9595_000978 [Malassezia furfur]|nr:hypothetical protein CBS9595_000978 [Malassezia furfur]
MAATFASARALLLLQVGVRLVTFVLNQLLVRTTTPAVFGAANVQLELVLSVVLALARDGVRATVMRRRDQLRSVHNLALLPVMLGGIASVVVGYVYMRHLAPDALLVHGAALRSSVVLYCLGAMLELLSEPLHTYALALDGYLRLRVAMEASAVLMRAGVAVALLQPRGVAWIAALYTHMSGAPLAPEACALLAFALSRAAYGATLLFVAGAGVARLASARQALATLLPVRGAPLDAETRQLVVVTSVQAALKFVLTEGDKLAVARLTTLEEQGGYALASNYGSLLARTVFQPIEESARLAFSEALGEMHGTKRTAERGARTSAAWLRVLLRAHMLLGAALVAFAPPLAQPFLMIVAGPRWATPPSHAAATLGSYCYYLPVMGVNGIVEAFLQSTAPPATLASYSRVLVGASATFVAVLAAGRAIFPALGCDANSVLVWANIAGLAVRVGVCLRYMARAYAAWPQVPAPRLIASLPSRAVLVTLLVSGVALRWQARPLGPPGTWWAPDAPLVPLATTAAAGAVATLVLWCVID